MGWGDAFGREGGQELGKVRRCKWIGRAGEEQQTHFFAIVSHNQSGSGKYAGNLKFVW